MNRNWKAINFMEERETNFGQPAPAEIPDEETAHGSSPEEVLMMKNPGDPTSSISDKRQYDREILFHQPPEADVPLHQVGRVGNPRISQNSFTS